jgi:hypothetical protein
MREQVWAQLEGALAGHNYTEALLRGEVKSSKVD